MKFKKEYVILAGVIVVLLVYLVFSSGRNKMSYRVPKLRTIPVGEIDKVEIVHGDRTVTLAGRGEAWRIMPQEYPADSVLVKDVLKAIENLALTELAAENPNDIRYELDEKNRIEVRAFKGEEPLRRFSIGKTSSTYRHTFVRIEDDDRVFYARESFRSDFDREVKDFRDKVVLTFDSAEISAVLVEKDGESLKFNKTVASAAPADTGDEESEEAGDEAAAPEGPVEAWKSEDGKSGDTTKIDALLSAVSDLRCDEFLVDDKPESMTEDPVYSVTLNGNKEYKLRIYPKQEGENAKYPALSSESAYVFLLSTYTAENIMKAPGDLLVESDTGDSNG